jgi:hypothetical protein
MIRRIFRVRLATACLMACSFASLGLTSLTSAQETRDVVEVFKSRAEVVQAEALNKQANAAIINADANHRKARAEVRKLDQETRKLSTENDLLEAKVHYDKRALYHTYQAAHRPKPSTPEQYAARARHAAPTRLSSYQLWSKPGYVRWPSMLLHNDYAEIRSQIDRLCRERSPADSGAGSQNCVDLQLNVDRFRTALNARIKAYKPADYIVAKKFLDSLALEATFPIDLGVDQVAQR